MHRQTIYMQKAAMYFACVAFIFIMPKVVLSQANTRPVISYVLKVDTADISGYDVEIHVQHAPHVFGLAMATHHEYDDRFWRYVENFTVKSDTGEAGFIKEDSAVWHITIPGNDALISYRLHLPTNYPYHPSHRPFLAGYGGLVGDIHSFMYMVGYTQLPSRVTFVLPADWQIATGLTATGDPKTFIAADAKTLLDCPVFIGNLRTWAFTVKGITHKVVYLPLPNATPFDTLLLVANIKKIVEQTVQLFGSIPYPDYTFLLRDGTYGALEHGNSVTIGAPSEMLANNMQELYEELAHEFCHSWNLVRIKPAEYTDLNYGKQQQSAGLWFSEGFTMLYADLLVRRAGLHAEDSTRIAHLEALTARYYADTGNTFIPPGKVSLASNEQPGLLGDYDASTHLQGELIGAMLDLMIRNATAGKRSLDDLMRLMFKRFGGNKGFYAKDIEQAAKEVCSCDAHSFFESYVYDGNAIDFNQYLNLVGLNINKEYAPAKDNKGQPLPDTRLYVFQRPGETMFRIALSTPASCWGRAALNTGDAIATINGQPVKTRQGFNDIIRNFRIGDTIIVEVERAAGIKKIPVFVSGYNTVITHITAQKNITPQQQKLFGEWTTGN